MTPSIGSTWIGKTPSGVVVVRSVHGESTVDRPEQGSFREPYVTELHNGQPMVDGTPLHPLGVIAPDFADSCGWYDGHGRELLLTQIPESYFGEPMVFLAEGDKVVRAYPMGAGRLLGEDGTCVDVEPDGLRLTTGDAVVMLARSPRYRETQVTFEAGGAKLAGTVITPRSAPGLKLPAAVVIHGAAGGQRDFCRLFVRPLLDAGVAVLIYDKAGHGESEGDGDPTIFEQADAASAGMDLLASLPDIDARRIGLAGFSNGMWAAPILAARRTDVAFMAGVGSPGVSMADAEVHRRTKVLREAGVGAETVAAAGEAWRCIFAIAGAGASTEDLTCRLDQALHTLAVAPDLAAYRIPGYARENPMLSAVPPMLDVAELIAMVSGEPEPQLLYDPAADYARMRCPVLLQYGPLDTSVPVDASVHSIKHAARQTGLPLTIRVYPGLEHMLNVVPDDITGLAPEAVMYGFHRFRFGPGVWHDLTDWLRNVALCGGVL